MSKYIKLFTIFSIIYLSLFLNNVYAKNSYSSIIDNSFLTMNLKNNKVDSLTSNINYSDYTVKCAYAPKNEQNSNEKYRYVLILTGKDNSYYYYDESYDGTGKCDSSECNKKIVHGPTLIDKNYNNSTSSNRFFFNVAGDNGSQTREMINSLIINGKCPKYSKYYIRSGFTLFNNDGGYDDQILLMEYTNAGGIGVTTSFASKPSAGDSTGSTTNNNKQPNNNGASDTGSSNAGGSYGNSYKPSNNNSNNSDKIGLDNSDVDMKDPWYKGYNQQISFCKNPGILRVFSILNILITIVKIAVPLLIIIFSSIDFFNAIMGSDEKAIKDAGYSLGKKFILGIIIFFAPTIVSVVINFATEMDFDLSVENNDTKYANCVKCLFGDNDTCSSIIETHSNK